MMPAGKVWAGLDGFLSARRKDLKRIAAHTRGEYELQDVIGEALLVAEWLASHRSATIDFADPAFQHLLLSHLYQRLVRYGEQVVRNARHFDQATAGQDGVDAFSTSLDSWIHDDRDPLTELIDAEDAADTRYENRYALADAYLKLAQQCDNRMPVVAAYLRLSVSQTYRRFARVRWLARHQATIFLPVPEHIFTPRPWRRYKLWRTPIQMDFGF
ncbi:MAG TPA: hypothetical protein VFM56_14525, partial [Solimonas sp.]|nr:hypothetical protein [Solimonas sp.]